MTLETRMIELFEALCDDFKKLLDTGEMSSVDRKSLMEFLKENEINCVGSNNKNITSITASMPFDEDVEAGRAINQ